MYDLGSYTFFREAGVPSNSLTSHSTSLEKVEMASQTSSEGGGGISVSFQRAEMVPHTKVEGAPLASLKKVVVALPCL